MVYYVLIQRAALIHVQDLTLGLVEPHEVHTGQLLRLVQVPLDAILSFWHVTCTSQLGVISKLAEKQTCLFFLGFFCFFLNAILQGTQDIFLLTLPLFTSLAALNKHST